MADKIPLDRQCDAGMTELYNALSMGIVQAENIEACKALIKTLEWMVDKADVIKVAAKLNDDEWIRKAKAEFPGATIDLSD